MQSVELLAPAGDYDCFLAAVKAGADAVYLGGNFSARAYAKNFTPEEILAAIDHAHLYGRKVYMTLNIVMKNAEMDTVSDYLRPFYEAGLDGVIIQDIGLFHFLKEHFPLLPLHASTQMTITDLEGIRLLAECGAKRVVLARELSLNEIRRIHQNTDTELECFIHGALCYAYSGKCLFSSMLGDRSGNRGRCAQPCRLPYDNEYLLSLKDICTIKILPKLIEAGIASFKIEGRMKSPDYVAGVTGIYRKYIDRYLSDPKVPYEVEEEDLDLLLSLYTRSEHSEGYYMQRNGRDMITIKKPGYVKADEETANEAFLRFTKDHTKLQVSMHAVFTSGKAVSLMATCMGKTVSVTGEAAEPAQNRSLTEEEVIKQLSKLGGTEFCLQDLRVDLSANTFYAVSKLNALRRSALTALTQELLAPHRRTFEETPNKLKSGQTVHSEQHLRNKAPLLHISVETFAQAKEALKCTYTDLLSLPLPLYQSHKEELKTVQKSRSGDACRLFITLPYICRDAYFAKHGKEIENILADPSVCGFLVRNYESLYYLQQIRKQEETDFKIIADLHLYALNKEACSSLRVLGADHTTVPVELHRKELFSRQEAEEDLIVYGRLPLMISAQCIRKTKEACMKKSGFCEITDRYHVAFPVQNSCEECMNVIYNSVPLSLHNETGLIRELHPYSVRLSFTMEDSVKTTERILDYSGLLYEDRAFSPSYAFTKGHLQRGVC